LIIERAKSRPYASAFNTTCLLSSKLGPMTGEGIFELARRNAEAAAQRRKPQPAQSVPQPGSVEWFEAQKKKG
jgi:hypothetical protein